jgi:acyl-CoA synthetase (AMP-forming)/AMP-acid ligase II
VAAVHERVTGRAIQLQTNVQPYTIVAIEAAKGIPYVIDLLALFKIGAVAVPVDPALAAFWVPKATTSVDDAEIRAFLAERLPAPMVPTIWRRIDAMPLNANGKADKKALIQQLNIASAPSEVAADYDGVHGSCTTARFRRPSAGYPGGDRSLNLPD